MNIEHIGVVVSDLEKMKSFYESYFGGKSGNKYKNDSKNFQSYFIEFDGGSRLELMKCLPDSGCEKAKNSRGFNHFTFETSSQEEVDNKFRTVTDFGAKIVEKPRWSGLGDYVGTLLDPEGNKVEILLRNKNMKNPFLDDGYLNTNASINKVKIVNLKSVIVEREYIGKYVLDLLSVGAITNYIKLYQDVFEFDESKSFIWQLKEVLEANDSNQKIEKAKAIVKKISTILAYAILVLKEGNEESRNERKDWNEANWAFWKKINKIYLAGGIASGILGEYIKNYCNTLLSQNGLGDKFIENTKYSSLLPIIGALKLSLTKVKNGLIFDFGQTNIKRAYFHSNLEKVALKVLESEKSQNVGWIIENDDLELAEAQILHQHICNIIIKTVSEIKAMGLDYSKYICASIANYIVEGKVANRGGYGKLRLLSNNYEKYLSEKLKEMTSEDFEVRFMHDGMSSGVALEVNENESAVVLSLGSAIGIGFPPESIKQNSICSNLIFEN